MTTDERPPYPLAGLVALGALALYVATLAPTAQFWDTPEYITAAYVLGIPHPPGNPLFVLLAHVWGLVPWAHAYAARINLLSAVASALSAGLWFLVAERWLRPIVPVRGPRRLAALAASLTAATAFTVWNQSVVNEKVYTLSLFSIALVLWLAVVWGDKPAGSRRDHLLLLIVYLLALTATNHLMGLLVAPAVLAYVLFTDPRALLSPKLLVWCAAAVALGVSVWLFLLLRAPHFPAINEGEPTTWVALDSVLSRAQYAKPPLGERQADLTAQFGMWWQYFTWQWGRDWPEGVRRALAALFGGLGLLGAVRHWKADRRSAAAMTALVVTLVPVLVYYLNFKFGFSQYPDRPTLPREVRERDYFFLCSFALWGIWIAIGLAAAMEGIQRALRRRIRDEARRWAMATPVLALALVPLAGNRLSASRAGETLARDFAFDLLQSVPPYAVLVTTGDNDTFPLWYAQEVEGVRRDVTVLNLSLAGADWYMRQLQRRPLATFDPAAAAPLWREHTWPKPMGALLHLTDEQLTAIQPYFELPAPRPLALGGITVTLDPQRLGQPYLERPDVITLRVVQDQLGRRPIAFSRTTATYADRLGLTPYLLGVGLVRLLQPAPVAAGGAVGTLTGFGLADIPRTADLLLHVFHSHTAARHRPLGWLDVPSESILVLYAFEYQSLAMALATSYPTSAARSAAIADSVFQNTSYRRTVRPAR
jgi:hypothetical protein